MDRRIIQRLIFVTLISFFSQANANCPLSDHFEKLKDQERSILAKSNCALNSNDEESQMFMADLYTKGLYGYNKDTNRALFMYQLAADNGNAEAQTRLAEILINANKTNEQREAIHSYLSKLESTKDSKKITFLHPYALLTLATEPVEKKWYILSKTKKAPSRASRLLSTFSIDKEKKDQALKQASQWKSKKIKDVAKEILNEVEYKDLILKLKDNKTQTETLKILQKKMDEYVQKTKLERSKPL